MAPRTYVNVLLSNSFSGETSCK